MDAQNVSVYKRIQIPKSIRPHNSNPVTSWWKKLSSPTIIKEANSVNSIDFSPVKPYNFIYASGSKSYLYNGHSNELVRTYTSKDIIHSCSYRSDGRLFCVGSRDGYVQIYDESSVKSNALRIFKAHDSSVFVSLFSQNNSQLFTASSDCVLKLWDISSASLIFSKECHSDRIKCGCTLPNNPNLFITGSYDHKVGLWDTRISESQKWIIDHGAPVESVLVHPNGLLLMSCGGNSVRIWDLANGGRLLHQMSPHFKTITRLNFSHCYSYFHSSSIDCNVKSYSMQTYEVLNSTKYDYPILDFCISPDNNRVGAALINNDESYGLVFLKCVKRKELLSETSSIDTASSEHGVKCKRYFHSEFPVDDIETVKPPKQVHYKRYERFLRKFEHYKAFKYIFDPESKVNSDEVLEVIKELMRRSTLYLAMKDSNAQDICNVIDFISQNIRVPRFSNVLIKLSNILLNGKSKFINLQENFRKCPNSQRMYIKSLTKLRQILAKEMEYLQSSLEVIGSIELIQMISNVAHNTIEQQNSTTLPSSIIPE